MLQSTNCVASAIVPDDLGCTDALRLDTACPATRAAALAACALPCAHGTGTAISGGCKWRGRLAARHHLRVRRQCSAVRIAEAVSAAARVHPLTAQPFQEAAAAAAVASRCGLVGDARLHAAVVAGVWAEDPGAALAHFAELQSGAETPPPHVAAAFANECLALRCALVEDEDAAALVNQSHAA